uniref:t-SNARE coiled-coil homology domain-containing protein n=1 Tax=Strongyloides venezuelensis TaxID=75913 RepID=A0A0K0F5B7_STRVS
MDGKTKSDIRIDLNIKQAKKLNNILLDHSKNKKKVLTDSISDRNDRLSKSYNEIQSFDRCLMYPQKNLHYNIKSIDENFIDLNRTMMICDRNIRNHLARLNDKMVNIKRSILDVNIILDRIKETSSLYRRNFAKKLQIGNLNKSRTQNFVENNSESPIFLSILKDSTNTEDFNIHDISLDNAFTGINTGNFSLWFDDINIEDYDKNNTILVKDKTIQSISDSCSDINSRDLLFCELETPSSLFCGSLSC